MAAGAKTTELAVEVRTRTGKGASRQARRDGKVPAVLYGHGAAPTHLELNARDFAAVLRKSGTNAVLRHPEAPEDFWKKSNPPVVLVLDALKLIWALLKALDLKKGISLESENKIVRRKVKQINTT